MRTTIELPDDLLRRAKATAALRGLKLKDLIAAFVERGLEASGARRELRGHKGPLPEFIPRTGAPIRSLSGGDVDDVLLREDLESLGSDRSS
jgi:hypothetical protein